MLLADLVRSRATCPRRQVGCVLIDSNKRIKATGYNGAPPTLPHCIDVGCHMVQGTCRRVVHAEANAIEDCRLVDRVGGTIYTTDFPCPDCGSRIARSGVVEVVYMIPYHTGMSETTTMLESLGISVRQYIPDLLLIEG